MNSSRDHPGSAALFSAIEAGDAQAVQKLTAGDRSLLAIRNSRGESPVLVSCYRRQRHVLDVLLAARPELDVWEAAAAGQLEAVRAHLGRDRSLVASYSRDGWTPLHLAAFFGHETVAAELLRRDASVEAWSRNELANQPLHAAAAGRNLSVCKLLVDAGADVNARQHGGVSPLHHAAQNGQQELVELLLDNGADRTARAVNGDTPSALATKAGHAAIAALLK
jgi:ankyrin repeat protein